MFTEPRSSILPKKHKEVIMLKSILLLSTLFTTYTAQAVTENQMYETVKNHILSKAHCENEGRENEPFWKIMTIPMKVQMPAEINRLNHVTKVKKIDYDLKGSKFGCGLGKHGSLVISPGRTESSIEYYETAMDFIKKGFSPVYVIDHVGQGFSPRLIEDDANKAHIHNFKDYFLALNNFVNKVTLDLKTVEGRNQEPLFFTSNSMGGAIGVAYFQMKGDKNPFKSAAILGPMLRVNYLGFPGGLSDANENPNGVTCPTRFQKVIGSEAGVIANAIVQRKKYGYSAYSTSNARALEQEYGTAYVFGKRDYDTSFALAPEQVMTHSKTRFEHKTFLWESKEMQDLYASLDLPSPIVAAPTVQWASESASSNIDLRKKSNLKKMSTKMPLAIITGSRDARAYNPQPDCSHDMSYHINFCKKMNQAVGKKVCQFTELKGAFHEIYKESDLYRDAAINLVVDHFLK
jgi:lysophospholipase